MKVSKLVKQVLSTAVASAMLASAAHATIISAGSNNPYSFNWSYSSAAGVLSGNGSLTLSGFNSSTLTVAVSLNNTSGIANNRLTSFGFGIEPNATSVSFNDASDGGMINASLDNIPSLATIEVCAFGGPNCSGGGSGGINGGASDSFSLALAGMWGSSVNIDPIGFKYQTGAGSYEFTTTDCCRLPPQGTVPEPAVPALMLLGSLALGLSRRVRSA